MQQVEGCASGLAKVATNIADEKPIGTKLTVDEKAAVLSTHFGKTPADFKTAAGKDYKKADYDAMFTAENGKDETMLATATAPPGSPYGCSTVNTGFKGMRPVI